MALLTDGQISTESDLQQYENSILDVAADEHIDTFGKMAIAAREIADEILLFILSVPLRDPKAYSRRVLGVSDVVITPALQRWHICKSISLIYGDAYGNQLNERYLAKLNSYETRTQWAKSTCLKTGVGLVFNPVPQAPAPTTVMTPGTGPAGTFYVAASWLNSTGQEGAISDVVTCTVTSAQSIALIAGTAPDNATGWNVYGGTAASQITLQNSDPLQLQTSWTLPATGLVNGRAAADGQKAEWLVVDDCRIQRG